MKRTMRGAVRLTSSLAVAGGVRINPGSALPLI